MKNVALVLSGLLAGLVAGTALVPRVLAEPQRPAGTIKWQQFCEGAGSITEASTMAAARGAEGYELIGFFGGALCFKRPVIPARHGEPSAPAAPGATSTPGHPGTPYPGNPYGI